MHGEPTAKIYVALAHGDITEDRAKENARKKVEKRVGEWE